MFLRKYKGTCVPARYLSNKLIKNVIGDLLD